MGILSAARLRRKSGAPPLLVRSRSQPSQLTLRTSVIPRSYERRPYPPAASSHGQDTTPAQFGNPDRHLRPHGQVFRFRI